MTKKNKDKSILDIPNFSELSSAYQRLVLKHLLDRLYHKEENLYKANYIELIQDWIIQGEVNTHWTYKTTMSLKKSIIQLASQKRKMLIIQSTSKNLLFNTSISGYNFQKMKK